jgi:hypothetical protein
MSNLCVLAWASTADHPFAWIAFITFAQLTAASYAAAKGASPLRWATISGVIALVVLATCLGPLTTIVYLIFGTPHQELYEDFFEDGVPFAIIAPFALALFYGPFFLIVGLICGSMVSRIRRNSVVARSNSPIKPSVQPHD